MDRHLAERMVGAAVLLGVLVLVVPAILDGGGSPAGPPDVDAASAPIDLQTRTIQIDGDARTPPVPNSTPLVPVEPAAPPEPELTPQADAPLADAAVSPGAAGTPPGADGESAGPPREQPSAPPVQDTPTASGDWFVQLGSFARRDNADRLAAAAVGRGFAAEVSELKGSGGRLFRVRAGPAASRAAAEALARELAAAGYAGTVTHR